MKIKIVKIKSGYRFICMLMLCLILMIGRAVSQDLLKGKDLSQLKSSQVTDEEIQKFKKQLADGGVTIVQAEEMATAKGMPQAEFAKIRVRVEALPNTATDPAKPTKKAGATTSERENNSTENLDTQKDAVKRRTPIDPLIFGSELFTATAPNFEPNLKLPTPLNYVLGPDDQVAISVYGLQEYNADLTISPEGKINIPAVGQLSIAGLTIEAATQLIRSKMENSAYPHLRTGNAKLSISLSRIRSIKVNIIGAVSNGASYTLSSLSTVLYALYVSGGPSANGSFREIELIRNGKKIQQIDLYQLLMGGDQTGNVNLKDNDIIRIPVYKDRIEIQGQVKRPGLFEVLPGENFMDVLKFASGFTEVAYKASVKVYKNTDSQRRLYDMNQPQLNSYHPESGDMVVVSKILNRFENRVSIRGAVYRPDAYELSGKMKVADLIRKADGLREDAFTSRGQIIRKGEDLTRSIIPFDIKQALAGDPENNIELRRDDEIVIISIQELKNTFTVTIQGEVKKPGVYEYVDNLTLKDLILEAGGTTDAALSSIEIARVVIKDSISKDNDESISTIMTNITDINLKSTAAGFRLSPFDLVIVPKKAKYNIPESVTVSGEVQFPRVYALSIRNERVSDMIKRAGGFRLDANVDGAFIKRYKDEFDKLKEANAANVLNDALKDTSQVRKNLEKDFERIPIDLRYIMDNPGSIRDIIVRQLDEIYVPKLNEQVKVGGAVLVSMQTPYEEDKSFSQYVGSAGGFASNAQRNKAYIVYANGRAASTRHFLWFKTYPKVKPGSEIVIPAKPPSKGLSTGELIGLASTATGLLALIFTITR